MYPATIFNWHDNSAITVPQVVAEIDDAPLFMQVFSADKGTEDLIEISGSNFDAMYGTMSFDKHGQSAIQAKNIIDNGGRLLAKRVVAEDSTLANAVIVANVAVTSGTVKVTWEVKTFTGCTSFKQVMDQANALLDDENGKYPLIVYCDNGRGKSIKAVRLVPDYSASKTVGKTFYNLVVYEGSNITEQTTISFDPTVVYSDTAYRLDQYTNIQISGSVIEDVYELYVAKIASALNLDTDVARSYDIIYGYTNRGIAIPNFSIDGADLDANTGIVLQSGSNGVFGDAPANSTAWTNAIVKVFNGSFTDEVWDVDQHKIAAVVDANYPFAVKQAIFAFVSFREDCFYFRDFGCGVNALNESLDTLLGIKAAYERFSAPYTLGNKTWDKQRNFFVSDYCSTYQIKDPTTKKNIEVTMTYDMAGALVNHIATVPFAPVAGTSNDMILPGAIKGTLNFSPVITPVVNQKEALDEIRVNYAIFEDDQCVVQSCYTSQEEYTQLSFNCNTIGIQRVLRAVRTACPKQRYSLSTGADLQDYATAVNNVLSNYVTNFDTLNFIYTQDPLKASQKIFYASIEFAFLSWAQTEIFDVYAINNQ